MALILRKATDLARPSAPSVDTASGLTLEEIKAAAAEAGFDPELVERAAHLLPFRGEESVLSRVIGGPVRHVREVHFPAKLTPESSARLLSVVRATVEQPGEGHADADGMSWHSRYGVSVTALGGADGTRVRIRHDQLGPFISVALMTAVGEFILGAMLIESVDSGAAALAFVVVLVSVLVLVRTLWASISYRWREKTGELMDALGRVLAESGEEAGAPDD